MFAAQVKPGWFRSANAEARLNQSPTLGEIALRPGQLEIIHVDDQQEPERRMPKARYPLGDGKEALCPEVLLAMAFPEPSCIGMAIESEHQWANGIPHLLPGWRPLLAWESHPCGNPTKLALCVGLFGIRLLQVVTRAKPIHIRHLCSLERGGTTRELLKHCHLPVLVVHLVAPKHDASFEFPTRVTLGEFGVLLNDNVEDATGVHNHAIPLSLSGDVSPLTNTRLVPTTCSAETTPLLIQRSARLGVLPLLLSLNGACNARAKQGLRVRGPGSMPPAKLVPRFIRAHAVGRWCVARERNICEIRRLAEIQPNG